MKHLKLLAIALLLGLCACDKDDDKEIKTTPLPTPIIGNVVATTSSLAISWTAVDGATQYGYELKDNGQSVAAGTASGTSVTITGLSIDTEFSFELWAVAPMHSKYSNSETATKSVRTAKEEVVTPDGPSMSIDGFVGAYTYESKGVSYIDTNNGENFDYVWGYDITRVEGTDDQIYLDNFYWSEYPFIGTVDFESKTITIEPSEWGYYTFAASTGFEDPVVGTFDDDYNITFEGWNGWYYWEADEDNDAGWYSYFDETVTTFTKGEFVEPEVEESPVDVLVGNYNYATSGTQYCDQDEDAEFSLEGTYSVSRVADNPMQLQFDNLYWSGYPVVGTVDMDAKTITFEAQAWGSYTFAGNDSETSEVVGTFDDNYTITIEGWNGWYYWEADEDNDAAWYSYFDNTKTVYTRIADSEAE